MLLKIFRSNQPYTVFFVLILAVIINLPLFLGNFSGIETQFTAVSGLFNRVPLNSWFIGTSSSILLFAGSVLLNSVFNREEFLPESNYLSSMWYILFLAPFINSSFAIPVMLGNVFLFIALSRLLKVFRQPRALAQYFESGFWVGLASLCFSPYLIFIPIVLLSIIYTRTFNFREVFMPLVGGSIPWIYHFSFRFLADKSGAASFLLPENTILSPVSGWTFWVLLVLMGMQLVISFIAYLNSYGRSTNKSKNTKSVFLIWALGAILSAFVIAFESAESIALPLASALPLILGFGSLKKRKDWSPKLIHSLILIIVVYKGWILCGF